MSVLPKGWASKNLGELCLVNQRVPVELADDDRVTFVPMPAVDEVAGEITAPHERRLREVAKGFTQFQELDVLFAKITPCMENGKAAIARRLINGVGYGSTEFHVLRSNGAVLPEYVWRYLRQEAFRRDAEAAMTGAVGQRRVPTEYLKAQVLPVPPFAEQRRIVAKLDSLAARTAKARAELERVPKLIAKYKQAILEQAFSGELTKAWRATLRVAERPSYSETGIDGRAAERIDLPAQWAWTSLGSVAVVSGGLTKSPKRDSISTRVPYLRVANVYANELRLGDIAEIGCTATELEKTRLESGDLLIVEGNGSLEQIGRVAIWSGEIEQCSHQNHIIRARTNGDVAPRYALYWLLSPPGRSCIERVASSSAGLHTLSITKVQGLPLPLCSIVEQQEIVRRIETAFSWLDKVAAEHARASHLLPKLDQAILAKAFRGELVPQDPKDEPASVLLETIKGGTGKMARTATQA